MSKKVDQKKQKPKVFEFSHNDLYTGMYGCTKQKTLIAYDTDNDGNNLNVDWELEHIFGWQDAIQLYQQCKELGLSDYDLEYDLEYAQTGGKSLLNLWI